MSHNRLFTLSIGFTLLICSVQTLYAGWLEFGPGCPDDSPPALIYNGSTEELLSFDVELVGLTADTVDHEGIEYLRFNSTPGTRSTNTVGYPELPVVTCFIAVPDASDLVLSELHACPTTSDALPVYPAPLDSLVSDSLHTPYYEEYFTKDSAAYESTEWYPVEQAILSGEFHLRDQRVAIVEVYPVQYLASEDSLRVWSDISISLQFEGADPVWNTAGLGYYDRLIGDKLLGYHPTYIESDPQRGTVFRHTDLSTPPPIDPDYMIIVADGLDGEWINSLADHRAWLNGFDVLITNLDDIFNQYPVPEPWPTPDLIRDYTEDIWEGTPPGDRPVYLLLIGDHEDPSCTSYEPWFLPAYQYPATSTEYPAANDDWFVYFDEPRETEVAFPDMIVGRISARTQAEVQNILSTIMEYEEPALPPYDDDLQYRRHLTRLSGRDDGYEYDKWHPSESWATELCNWMDYTVHNYYCVDGNPQTTGDGSILSSRQWIEACMEEFQRGSQLLFYSDHGSVHYFECGLNEGFPGDWLGQCDSTFDDLNIRAMTEPENSGHLHPFVMLLSCSQNTYNWTYDQHYTSWPHWNNFNDDPGAPLYDFGVDCFAEELMKNTEAGAIGVYGASWASYSATVLHMNMIEALYYYGETRIGDLLQAGRFMSLDYLAMGGLWSDKLGYYNLLGDPATDIGDRVKFPSHCDLIVSPDDLEINRYPTLSVNGGSGYPELYVTVRNAGASASGPFEVSLDIECEENVWNKTSHCGGLDLQEEQTLSFSWPEAPPGFTGELYLTACADPQESVPDSWLANNEAERTVEILDFYPNQDGWPVRTAGSVHSPPILCNLDSDADLEIVTTAGEFIEAWDVNNSDAPIWRSGPFHIANVCIPVAADIDNGPGVEILLDTRNRFIVLDGTDGSEICSIEHDSERIIYRPHTVTVADVFGDIEGLEIALVRREVGARTLSLDILSVDHGQFSILDQEDLPQTIVNYSPDWITALDCTPDGSMELSLSYSWYSGSAYHSGLWIYDHVDRTQTSEFIDSREWLDHGPTDCIQCSGSLPMSGERIAMSRQYSSYPDQSPAILLDPDDLSNATECVPPTKPSDRVLCCIMADWDPIVPGLDRVIANADNQAMAWEEDGDLMTGWSDNLYSVPGNNRPPFPALGNLDNTGVADLLVATREGYVMALDYDASMLNNLGFPYSLPSFVTGGFTVADIDNDGYVEVVFGTMDNYLHIWELGECVPGYSPWPQCQRDAARTGVLLEE